MAANMACIKSFISSKAPETERRISASSQSAAHRRPRNRSWNVSKEGKPSLVIHSSTAPIGASAAQSAYMQSRANPPYRFKATNDRLHLMRAANYDRVHPISIPTSPEEKSDTPKKVFFAPPRTAGRSKHAMTITDVLCELKSIVEPLKQEICALRKVTADLQHQVRILQDENHKMHNQLGNMPGMTSLQQQQSKNAEYPLYAYRTLKENAESHSRLTTGCGDMLPMAKTVSFSTVVSADLVSLSGTIVRQGSTEADGCANTASLFPPQPLELDTSSTSKTTNSTAPRTIVSPRNMERIKRMDQTITKSMQNFHDEENMESLDYVTFRPEHCSGYSEQIDITMGQMDDSSNDDQEVDSNLWHYDAGGVLSDSTAITTSPGAGSSPRAVRFGKIHGHVDGGHAE